MRPLLRPAVVGLLLLVGGWEGRAGEPDQQLRVSFFDVGQGDGVLIQSPSGQNVVVDGGQLATGMRDHLRRAGVRQIDLVVASHNHADHIGGLAAVIQEFRPRFYLDNGIVATTLTYRRVLDAVKAAGTQLLEPVARRVSLGTASLVVVPPPGVAAWEQNDNSVGIIVEYGAFRISMAGDAEGRQWAWWLEHEEFAKVQVHKASHHGSRNGDTAAAIARLAPEVVIVSAGRGNSYGHPAPQALAVYGGQGATVYRTDLHGTVVVEAEASGHYTVRVEPSVGARPPPAPTGAPGIAAQPTASRSTGCVNINTAGLAELQRIIHVGPARAQQILELRKVRPFASANELARVSGIAVARLRDIVAQGLVCTK